MQFWYCWKGGFIVHVLRGSPSELPPYFEAHYSCSKGSFWVCWNVLFMWHNKDFYLPAVQKFAVPVCGSHVTEIAQPS